MPSNKLTAMSRMIEFGITVTSSKLAVATGSASGVTVSTDVSMSADAMRKWSDTMLANSHTLRSRSK